VLFQYFLRHFVQRGKLTVINAKGVVTVYQGEPGPDASIRLTDHRLEWQLLLNPWLWLGEAYMDGRLIIEKGTLYDFLDLLTLNQSLLSHDRLSHFQNMRRPSKANFHLQKQTGSFHAAFRHGH